MSLEVKEFVAALLKLNCHTDDGCRITMVHPQVVQERDGPLAVSRCLNGRVTHVQRVFTEPTRPLLK